MHGLTTISKLNREAAEADEIMARAGYVKPDYAASSAQARANGGPAPTHTHIPLEKLNKAAQ